MKKLFLLLLIVILFINCTLIEPSKLIIKNDSRYDIKVNLNNGDKQEIIIEKSKGDLILIYPGDLELKIEILNLGIKNTYNLKINYLENKKFIFSTDI